MERTAWDLPGLFFCTLREKDHFREVSVRHTINDLIEVFAVHMKSHYHFMKVKK